MNEADWRSPEFGRNRYGQRATIPDYLTRKICANFIRAARFNVTRIIKFRAPAISIFEAMHVAKRLPGISGRLANDESGIRRQSGERRELRTPEGDAPGLHCGRQEAPSGIPDRHPG